MSFIKPILNVLGITKCRTPKVAAKNANRTQEFIKDYYAQNPNMLTGYCVSDAEKMKQIAWRSTHAE